MTITQTITEVSADLAAAGFSPAEVEAIMAWKPFCPFEGCVCDKYADCDYCEACTGETDAADAAYAEFVAEQDEQARPFFEFLFGAPEADDDLDW
jgi:hypothetical protein